MSFIAQSARSLERKVLSVHVEMWMKIILL
jgi:hypothetical protein